MMMIQIFLQNPQRQKLVGQSEHTNKIGPENWPFIHKVKLLPPPPFFFHLLKMLYVDTFLYFLWSFHLDGCIYMYIVTTVQDILILCARHGHCLAR